MTARTIPCVPAGCSGQPDGRVRNRVSGTAIRGEYSTEGGESGGSPPRTRDPQLQGKNDSHNFKILGFFPGGRAAVPGLNRPARADLSLTAVGLYNTGYDGSGNLYTPEPANTVSPTPQVERASTY